MRLKEELTILEKRRIEILETAIELQRSAILDGTSINFLINLCNSPWIERKF